MKCKNPQCPMPGGYTYHVDYMIAYEWEHCPICGHSAPFCEFVERVMSYDSLLIDICTIQRFAEGAQDAGTGWPAKAWADLHTDEPCRHVSGKGREIKVGQEVVIIYDTLFVGDIDVTEQDRVVLGGLTYNILSVVFRQDGTGDHHKQLYLETVK